MSDGLLIVSFGLTLLSLVVGIKWVRGKWLQRSLKFLPESMKDGSTLVTVPLISFPFVVGIYSVRIRNPDKKEYKGTGTIIDGHIITANHVIDEVKPVLASEKGTHQLYARTFDGQYHLLGDWIQIHTDAIYFKAPPGYKSAKVEPLQRPQHAQVVSAREQGNSSMGILRNKPDIAFGFVEYEGSTLHGFSGAPYTNGQKVMGIHLQGGSAGNFGYSASFLVSKMRKINRPESSEWEAFERALAQASQEDIDWERGLDETEVRVGGRYFLFDNEEFDTYIEESEFMDWFYEDVETGRSKRFKKKKKAIKDFYDMYEEPDYECSRVVKEGMPHKPEDVQEVKEENAFLGVTPPPTLSGEDLKKAIDSLNTTMTSIQNSLISLQKDLDGLKEREENWNVAFTSMQQLEEKLTKHLSHQLETRLTGLELSLTESITSDLRGHLDSMNQNGTLHLGQSSGPSTQQVVQGSENSPNMEPLVKRWDGMDSDFEKFRTWRNSVNVSDPEYASWRDVFLTNIGLNPMQSQILINRMKNYLRKLKHRQLAREVREYHIRQTE